MVLWVSAALSAIAFSLASTVRGEAERTSTAVDGLRSYYLAVGGVQRGMLEVLWSALHQEKRTIPKGSTYMEYQFPSGVVGLEIMPEAGKLSINRAPVTELVRLLIALGESDGQARAIASAISDWRGTGGGAASLDGFYRGQTPSFRSPRASFQEIEELLLVKGVTPELFYGSYLPSENAGARLVRRYGLMDCVSVYGTTGQIDVNTASPPVLSAIGLNSAAITALVERRARAPLKDNEVTGFLGGYGAPTDRLRVEGYSMVTFRGTARLRLPNGQLSDMRRTVGALVKYMQPGSKSAIDVLRWYDMAWSF